MKNITATWTSLLTVTVGSKVSTPTSDVPLATDRF